MWYVIKASALTLLPLILCVHTCSSLTQPNTCGYVEDLCSICVVRGSIRGVCGIQSAHFAVNTSHIGIEGGESVNVIFSQGKSPQHMLIDIAQMKRKYSSMREC